MYLRWNEVAPTEIRIQFATRREYGSNGTLSLRFMQNAQRAKQQAQIHAEQAKISDDAEWHVSKEIQDAWAIGPSATSSSSVTHELSYLPFLFPCTESERGSDLEGSSFRGGFQGRRSFKRGKEVIREEVPMPKPEESPQTTQVASAPTESRLRQGKKPVSISGFKSTAVTSASTSKAPKTATAARSLIYQDTDVGTDLKSARRQKTDPPPFTTPAFMDTRTGFMKPVGIDEPPETSSRQVTSEPNISPVESNQDSQGTRFTDESIIQMAKSQTTTNLKKRSREERGDVPVLRRSTPGVASLPTHVPCDDVSPKKRKKKKTVVVLE